MKKFLIVSIASLLMSSIALGQDAASASASPSPSTASTAEAERVVVQSQEFDISREQIVPSLGATRYTVGPDRLDSQAQGENAPFNQTMLRFPGVAQDSFGQLHVRGEHANLQYRIDDVLIPESIPGFGQVLETRFADNISLITGALPAQFGFRNTGVIDIHTKNGAVFQQGDASVYGGSFDTIMPSLEYGGVAGKTNYYVTGSYLHDGIGIENPTRTANPIHDDTDQYRMFGYSSYIIDDTSRFVLLTSGYHGDFDIPNNPGQAPQFTDMGRSTFNSAKLDETQVEQRCICHSRLPKERSTISICRRRFSPSIVRSCFGPIMSAISFSTALPHALIATFSRMESRWTRATSSTINTRSAADSL